MTLITINYKQLTNDLATIALAAVAVDTIAMLRWWILLPVLATKFSRKHPNRGHCSECADHVSYVITKVLFFHWQKIRFHICRLREGDPWSEKEKRKNEKKQREKAKTIIKKRQSNLKCIRFKYIYSDCYVMWMDELLFWSMSTRWVHVSIVTMISLQSFLFRIISRAFN